MTKEQCSALQEITFRVDAGNFSSSASHWPGVAEKAASFERGDQLAGSSENKPNGLSRLHVPLITTSRRETDVLCAMRSTTNDNLFVVLCGFTWHQGCFTWFCH